MGADSAIRGVWSEELPARAIGVRRGYPRGENLAASVTPRHLLIWAPMATQPVTQDPRRELEMLLASRFALIVIESREETRVLALVRESSLKAAADVAGEYFNGL